MRALALLLLPLVSGCSLLFVESPPPVHARQPDFDCTSSRIAPIVDTVVATTYGLTGVGMAAFAASGEVRGEAVPMVFVAARRRGSVRHLRCPRFLDDLRVRGRKDAYCRKGADRAAPEGAGEHHLRARRRLPGRADL